MMWRMYAVAHAGTIQYIRASSWFNVKREMARIYGAEFVGIEFEFHEDGTPRPVHKFDDARWLYKVAELREEES